MNLFIWIFPNITVTSNFEGNFWKYQGLWLTWTDRWRRHHLGRLWGGRLAVWRWNTSVTKILGHLRTIYHYLVNEEKWKMKWGVFFKKNLLGAKIGNKKYFTLPPRSITSSQKVSFPNSIFTFDFTLKWIVI